MSDSLDHLVSECQNEARLGSSERVTAILTERWINYPRAAFALERLEHLLHHPPRDRMPCLLLFGATGMGKTKILRKFTRDHPALLNSRTGIKGMPLVVMQMPPDPDEKAFYLQLLNSLNRSNCRLGATTTIFDDCSLALKLSCPFVNGPICQLQRSGKRSYAGLKESQSESFDCWST